MIRRRKVPRSDRQAFPYLHAADKIRWNGKAYVKYGPLYLVYCSVCGDPCALKSAGDINRNLKKSGGKFYCSLSCHKFDPSLTTPCYWCGVEFQAYDHGKNSEHRFCSRACYNTWQRSEENHGENHPRWLPDQERECPQCGKAFRKRYNDRFCSMACAAIWKGSGVLSGENSAVWLSDQERECAWCGETFRKLANVRFCSRACRTAWAGSGVYRGENGHNWKGGVEARDCHRADYREWRRAVYKRDDYTCQACGARKGGLNAHHTKTVRHFPDLELDVSNGVTLCAECHHKMHRGKRRAEYPLSLLIA